MVWFTLALVLAALAALAAVGLWLASTRTSTRRARRLADGSQEVHVVVDRGYVPSRVDLEAGVPATLRFERREDDPCTEMLVSELWPTAHRLIAHGETSIRFTPEHPGRFVFTCGMGMYSGELIVHERGRT